MHTAAGCCLHLQAPADAATLQRLTETKGLSEAKIEKALEAAKKMCTNYGWQSATMIGAQVLMADLSLSIGHSASACAMLAQGIDAAEAA